VNRTDSENARADDPALIVPRLAAQVERLTMAGGVLRLRMPLRRSGRLNQAWCWLLRLPAAAEVELDEIGAFVVERLDGRSLGALADDLAGHLQLTRREAEVALADFMRMLSTRRLVALERPQRPLLPVAERA
jgi:hypothetical protein